MKKAFITGITGQDGSYLADLLLEKGYEVHGMIRRASTFNTVRINHLYKDPHQPDVKLFLHFGDLTDVSSMNSILAEVQPDEIYNLGAQSHVMVSFKQPEYTADTIALGTLRLLEAMKNHVPWARFYQASSSEMFGDTAAPQDENSKLSPLSPYACAKVMAHQAAINYRRAYGMFVCCGTLFNHESPRRAETFVTRKITRAATRIKLGLQEDLYLGNLDAKRDWGYAKDYVRAMYLMLQAKDPADYVIATGESFSVRNFLYDAFTAVGLDWQKHVKQSPRYFRPSEVEELRGDAYRAREQLGWKPTVGFHELVQLMVKSDMELAIQEHKLGANSGNVIPA